MKRVSVGLVCRCFIVLIAANLWTGVNAREANWNGPAATMLNGGSPPGMTCGSAGGCHGAGNNNTAITFPNMGDIELPAGATTFTLTGSQMGIPSGESWALRYKVNGTISSVYVKDDDSTERVITVPATGSSTFDYCVGHYRASANSNRNLFCSEFEVTHAEPPPVGTVGLTSATYTGSEASREAVVTLSRTGGTNGAVTATVTASPGTATAADFTGTTFSASWSNGQAGNRTIRIPIVDDSVHDPGESFSIRISSRTGGSSLGRSSATVSITDNDPAPAVGTVSFSNASFTGSEDAQNARVTLRRSGGTSGAVTATVAASPGSASASDYTGSSFSVTWANGTSGTRNLDIPIVDDAQFEGSESFTITISNATGGATIGTPRTANVNITDNDAEPMPGVVSLTANSFDGSESDENATVTLTRTGGSDGAVTATVTASAGTASTADFTGTTFTASWGAGQSGTRTITIPVVDDDIVEGTERFNVALSNASGGATVGSNDSATVTILDNDEEEPEPMPGVVSLTANSFDGSENDENATVTLTRTGGSDGAVTATVTASAGTASTADFTGTTFTASWGAGQSGTRTITIPVVDDDVVEGTERFNVALSNVSGGATVGSNDSATVTILDNDEEEPEPRPGVVSLTANSFDGSESDENATVTLTRTGGSDGAVTATVTASAGTASTADFTGTTFTAMWGAGQSGTRTITIPVIDDDVVEGAESFNVALSNASGGATVGSNDSATVTILDNDEEDPEPSPGVVSLAANSFDGSESDENATITLRRTGGSDGAVTATVTASAGTASTADFTGTTFTAMWGAGQSGTRTITIPVVDDDVVEDAETFTVTLSDVSGGATVGSNNSAVVTIADNDAEEPPVVVPPPVTTPPPVIPPSTACTAFGRSLVAAKREYAANCTLPRVDCDPMDGGWLCSSEQIGSGKPLLAVDVTEEQGEACVATGPTLAVAKRNYADSCTQRRRDCDPIDGQWMCSSQVIGDNAPVLFTSVASTAENITRDLTTQPASCSCMTDPAWSDAFLTSVTTGEYGHSIIDSVSGEVDVSVYRGAGQSLLSVSYSREDGVATCAIGRAEGGRMLVEHMTVNSSAYDDAVQCGQLLIDDAVPQPGWLKVKHSLTIAPVSDESSEALTVNGYALVYPESYRVTGLSLDDVMSAGDLLYQSSEACSSDGSRLGVLLTSSVVDIVDDPEFLPDSGNSSGSSLVAYETCDGQLIGEFTFPNETWIPFARNGGQILRGTRLTD